MNTKVIISIVGIVIIVAGAAWWFTLGTSRDNTNLPEESNTQEFITGSANVDSIDIMLLESFPVQVRVTASGQLPDGCTEIDSTNVELIEETFNVSITTKRPKNAVCTQALVPFEETVNLPVEGLDKGTYTANVNGVTKTFTLEFDNEFQGSGKQ